MLINYLKWCWRLKTILPWSTRLVDNRELTKEEYEYPATRNIYEKEYKHCLLCDRGTVREGVCDFCGQ